MRLMPIVVVLFSMSILRTRFLSVVKFIIIIIIIIIIADSHTSQVLQALFSISSFSKAFASESVGDDVASLPSVDSTTTWRRRRMEMLADMRDDEVDGGEGGGGGDGTGDNKDARRRSSSSSSSSLTVGDQSLSTEFRELCRMIDSHKQIRYTPDGILRLVWRLFSTFRGFKQVLMHLYIYALSSFFFFSSCFRSHNGWHIICYYCILNFVHHFLMVVMPQIFHTRMCAVEFESA
jgi:hypothetical protein